MNVGLLEVTATQVADDFEQRPQDSLGVLFVALRLVGFSGCFVGRREGFFFDVYKSTERLEVYPDFLVFPGHDLSLL
jgi:hypothetical protein